jgi:(S)-2-hydroxyglutarate dehydrogenase
VSGRGGADVDVAVVGAGLVGLSTAMALLAERPGLRVAVLDKENRIASHQSGHNSGVLHAGLYYAPGSLKARFCREGRAALIEFAEEHRIPYRLCGKLVVAVSPAESARFTALAERGRENGLAVSELAPDEFRAVEPNVTGLRALHVPESGVIDYGAVAAAYARVIEERGGAIRLGQEVRSPRELGARAVVVCAGLQADRLAGSGERIVPFRGDYYTFRPAAEDLVRGLVYPVPDPAFPFLGVHFTRRIDGRLLAGPNAVPALAREGYSRTSVQLRDAVEVLRHPGLRKLARSYARTGAAEFWRDLVKPAFVAELRRYVPSVRSHDVTFGPTGIRAQVLARDGRLVDDFLIEEDATAVHVLNAPSPAATASIPIGREVAARAIARFAL